MTSPSRSQLSRYLGRLRDTPRIVASGNHVTPWHTLGLIDEELSSYRLWVLNAQKGIPDRDGVILETAFVGPGMRRSPRLSYTPSRLSLVPRLFSGLQPPDLVLLHTTVPRDGKVSLGTEVNILPAAVEAVRRRGGIVVAQVNPRMPWTFGDALLDVDQVDLMIEADEPLLTAPAPAIDEESALIGERVAARVPDGATLQAGIGAVPDAALRGLKTRTGLRVWTEMFSDSVLALEKVGALDRQVKIQTSFIFGSEELLEWVDGNERIKMLRTETTNNPTKIARNPAMVSVNTALQVDLFGQANASRIKARIHSGFGGQTDFIVGAMHAPEGKAFIALPSWHEKSKTSTIVGRLAVRVTSFQQTAVVTEQGMAHLWGRSQSEQARELIDRAAHPMAREDLERKGRKLGLLGH